MMRWAQVGQFIGGDLLWTPAPNQTNIGGSRAAPATPSAAPVIPFECDLSP
jgi:hypothetical protein